MAEASGNAHLGSRVTLFDPSLRILSRLAVTVAAYAIARTVFSVLVSLADYTC